MPDTWDKMGALVLDKLNHVADKQEEQTKEMSEFRSDLRLLNFKMFLIGFVTAAAVSSVVSGLIGIIFFSWKK